jgi:hypothetical protein
MAGIVQNVALVLGRHSSRPMSLHLALLENDFTQVYELPSDEVVVIVPCELMAMTSNLVIIEPRITLSVGSCDVDCDEGNSSSNCWDLINKLYYPPVTLLNKWLSGEISLPDRKLKGIIVASGWGPLPASYFDRSPSSIHLHLLDKILYMSSPSRLCLTAARDANGRKKD